MGTAMSFLVLILTSMLFEPTGFGRIRNKNDICSCRDVLTESVVYQLEDVFFTVASCIEAVLASALSTGAGNGVHHRPELENFCF